MILLCPMIYLESTFNFTYAWVWGYLFLVIIYFYLKWIIEYIVSMKSTLENYWELPWQRLLVLHQNRYYLYCMVFMIKLSIYLDTIFLSLPYTKCCHGTKYCQWMCLLGVCLWNYFLQVFTLFRCFQGKILLPWSLMQNFVIYLFWPMIT